MVSLLNCYHVPTLPVNFKLCIHGQVIVVGTLAVVVHPVFEHTVTLPPSVQPLNGLVLVTVPEETEMPVPAATGSNCDPLE